MESSVPSTTITTTAVLASLLMMATLVTLTQACKPIMDPDATLEYKTSKSDVLVSGYARQKTRDTRFQNKEVYVVEFEVRCIFKGGPVPEMINIYNVGMTDPMCKDTEFPLDKRLIVYLRRNGDNLMPTFKEDIGTDGYLDELPIICGITISYPIGYSKDKFKEECPEEWDDDSCIPLPTTEIAPIQHGNTEVNSQSPNENTGKEAPYQPVKSGDGDNSSGKEVKIGDQANKGGKGGKKSENKKDEELETTTPSPAGEIKASLIISLAAFLSFVVCVLRV